MIGSALERGSLIVVFDQKGLTLFAKTRGSGTNDLIPTMPDQRLVPLIQQFATMLAELPLFADTFGPV